MLYLALECSTACGSVALLRGTEILTEEKWSVQASANQMLPRVLTGWQAQGRLDLREVDCFVLGVGPGSYTGLRFACAFAAALALPAARPIYALSSAEVMAWQLAAQYPHSPLMIVGDARRDQYWCRIFRAQGLAPVMPETDWLLVPPGQLPWRAGLVAATADWPRLGATLRGLVPPSVTLLGFPVYPEASALARLAALRLADALPSLPPQPIYLHGPVKRA